MLFLVSYDTLEGMLGCFFLLQNLKESSQVTAQDFNGNQDGNHTCVGQVCALKEI